MTIHQARLLLVGLTCLADQPSQERAEALQRAMLGLMKDDDKPHYAHPMFWAAFVVVGEGAGRTRKNL